MIGREFFQRSATQVAKDLVGRVVVEFRDPNHIILHGILTEVDAYDKPLGREDEVFRQDAGRMGYFSSRRGHIPIITAHKEGGSGLVTLRAMVSGDTPYGPIQIIRLLGFEEKNGVYVGKDSGLYLGDSGIDLKEEGLRVVNEMPTDGPENRVAYWKLKRT